MIWGAPSETSSLNSYRVSWGLTEHGLTSYKAANSDTGGNAYPDASATSLTITGLAPGEYAAFVRARYGDNHNGPFKESATVVVAGSASAKQEEEPPTPKAAQEPTPEPTPEPALRAGEITGLTLTSSRAGHLWVSWNEADPAPTEYRLNWAPVGQPFPSWNSRKGATTGTWARRSTSAG